MLEKQKNKMNLRILEMLRDKGAPSTISPFPGEQDFESTDLDLDEIGDILIAGDNAEAMRKKKKKKAPEDLEPSQGSVNIIGKP